MVDDNIVQMPLPLERLATQIKRDISRCKEGRQQWADAAFDLCVHLAEARQHHRADIAFGEWCEANGFGENVINHQTRAAAIAMGRDPEAMRKCFEATRRHSLLHIHNSEFPWFTHVCKPTGRSRKSRRTSSPELQLAREAVRPLVEQGEPISRTKLAEKLGVSVSTIHEADHQERGRLEGIAEVKAAAIEPLASAEMRPTTKQRYDAALRAAEKRLRAEIIEQVNQEFDVYLKHWKARIARSDRIIASHKGVMSRKQFRLVLAGLHPDHNTFAQAEAAFELFKQLEDVLVKPDELSIGGPALPETIAEMMEAKRQATAARKTKRATWTGGNNDDAL